jgi:molecular chaperone HtpG
MSTATQTYEFRAEIQQLLSILVHSLYTDREIFLRELISNASDAINRVRFEQLTNKDVVDADAEPSIHVSFDKDAKTITISDNGIGMNREEMIENLGTIAHSGASTFLAALKEKNTSSTDIIGQFGVGFYSVFMVADKVSVTSRSYRPDETAYTWTSDGSNAYTIEPAEKTTRGTEIVVHLKEDAEEFADEYRLKNIIKKHSNYVAFPVYVGENVANAQTAIWRRTPREVTEDEYKEFYQQLTYDFEKPLVTIHQVSDAPVQFYSLLFIPSKLDRGLFQQDHQGGPQLYARKVLIQQHSKDLLPDWMRFIQGVVDSEDLPLNISRETVQSNRLMQRLKQTLTGKVITELNNLSEKDPDKFLSLWNEFGRLIKEGIVTDIANKDRLAGLVRFHSSTQEGWVTLKDYIGRMVEGQTEIYYLFGDDLKSLQRSPHLEPFKSRGIEVLLLNETIDSFMVNSLPEYDGKKLHNASDADLNLPEAKQDEDTPQEDPLVENVLNSLLNRIETVLGDKVAAVRESKVLTTSPARLVSSDKGFGADMERVYKALGQEYESPKRILEINPRHALIHNLSSLTDETLAAEVVEALYGSAMLDEGIHPNPADMVPLMQKLMLAATKR